MRKLVERSHWWHAGVGANRKVGTGIGCNCPENIIMLTWRQHDILDGRQRDPDVEHYKAEHAKFLETYPASYRHRIAFALVYRYCNEFLAATFHHEERMQGKARCCK